MTHRAAVIGCGNIGSKYDHERKASLPPLSHCGAYTRHAEYELVGIADTDPERLAASRERWSVPAYRDFSDLLTIAKPTVVSIATPPGVRLEVVSAAVAAGVRAIWCEKPLACTPMQARQMNEMCTEAGVVLAVNFIRRWDPAFQTAQQLIVSGELGRVQRAVGTYVSGLANHGTHMLDLINWWCGPIERIDWCSEREPGSPDVRLQCARGVIADLLSLASNAYEVFELDVYCRTGRIGVRRFGHEVAVWRAQADAALPQYTVLGQPELLAGDMDGAMLAALDDIAACLRTGTSPRCSGSDGVVVADLLDKACITTVCIQPTTGQSGVSG